MIATLLHPQTYLIIVTTATTGGSVPFSSRRTFFHAKRTAKQHTKYTKQKPSTPNKNQVLQTKQQVCQPNHQVSQTKDQVCEFVFQMLIYAVFLQSNFCTFSTIFVVFFKSLKIWWCIKNDKYQVCRHHHHPPL